MELLACCSPKLALRRENTCSAAADEGCTRSTFYVTLLFPCQSLFPRFMLGGLEMSVQNTPFSDKSSLHARQNSFLLDTVREWSWNSFTRSRRFRDFRSLAPSPRDRFFLLGGLRSTTRLRASSEDFGQRTTSGRLVGWGALVVLTSLSEPGWWGCWVFTTSSLWIPPLTPLALALP